MDSELIKFTQEIESPHHQRDIMAGCLCGLTPTHASTLSSKHKFVSNHTIVSVVHEGIRGELPAPLGLSFCLWVFVRICSFVLGFFNTILLHNLSYPSTVLPLVSLILISMFFFLSLCFPIMRPSIYKYMHLLDAFTQMRSLGIKPVIMVLLASSSNFCCICKSQCD